MPVLESIQRDSPPCPGHMGQGDVNKWEVTAGRAVGMFCSALLWQGHHSWPQPEESGMDPWQSLAQAGSGYLGLQRTRKQNMLQLAGSRQRAQLRQLPLSLHVTCLVTFPIQAPTTQACEYHQLLPHTEPSFFQPVQAHKNKLFSQS